MADPSMVEACKQALAYLRQGNHHEALTLINQTLNQFPTTTSPLIHIVNHIISLKIYSITTHDPIAQRNLIRNTVKSAKKASTLAPNSLTLSFIYAHLLLAVAAAVAGDGDVVRLVDDVEDECRRALALENPADPDTENFYGEPSGEVAGGAGMRIALMRRTIESLMNNAAIASISLSMMRRRDEDGEMGPFRLVPIPKVL